MEKVSKKYTFVELPHAEATLDQKFPVVLNYFKQKFNNCVELSTSHNKTFSVKILGQAIWFRARYINGNKTGKNKIAVKVAQNEYNLDDRVSKRNADKVQEVKETYTLADGSSRIDFDSIIKLAHRVAEKNKAKFDEEQKIKLKKQLEQMQLLGKIAIVLDPQFKATKYHVSDDVSITKSNGYEVLRVMKDNRNPGIYCMRLGYQSFIIKREEIVDFMTKVNPILHYVQR